MNILFINSIGKNKLGGGEKWMVGAARGLSEAGHTVCLASKKNSEIIKFARNNGINTHVFNIQSDFSPLNTFRITRYLKRHKIDVLVCNLNKDVRVAGLAARLIGSPVVIARHGMLLCSRKWKHKITLTNLVDGILTNTETVKKSYLEYGWFDEDFFKVIYNGIGDKSHVESVNLSTTYPDKKVIFSAGRLADQKGFEYLIKTAAILAKERQDVVFLIAGKGRIKKNLQSLCKDLKVDHVIHFLGYIDDIDPYLKACHLFVLSSIFEGMPNVVMEAMAVGKAVVATDVNGVRELMVEGETGEIVPPRNPEVLAQKINNLIDNPDLLDLYGKNGLQRVQQLFTRESMIRNIEKYFLEKINEKNQII